MANAVSNSAGGLEIPLGSLTGGSLYGQGLLGYRRYKVIDSDPEADIKGMRVFAKDPFGAAAQIYHVYMTNRTRPRKKIKVLLERGHKFIHIHRKKDSLFIKYAK